MLQKMKSRPVRLGIGMLGMIALFQTISITVEAQKSYVAAANSFLGIWVCVFSALLYDQVCQKAEIEEFSKNLIGSFYGIALGTALTAGKYLETAENLNVGDWKIWLNILILSVYFTPFVLFGWQWLEKVWKTGETEPFGKRKLYDNSEQSGKKEFIEDNTKKKKLTEKGTTREFFKYWVIIFVCWVPVFLAFYPGAFVYDATDEYVQVATRQFTTHHPLAHVLLLGGFVCAGNKFFNSFFIFAFYYIF